MGTKYRVDRVDTMTAPCGMASILYLGDNERAARRVLNSAEGGRDAWNKPNPAYGVAMFEWNQLKYEYVPKAWHSLPAMQKGEQHDRMPMR